MLPHRHGDGQGACDAFRISKCSACCTHDGVARKHEEAIGTLRDQYLLIIVVIFLVFLVHFIRHILDRVTDNPLCPI